MNRPSAGRRRMAAWAGAALLLAAGSARPHEIPDARIDRAIQVVLAPGRVEVVYEVSLAELTLVQDLRSLVGPLPAMEPAELYDRYAREAAPLNAKGILVERDGVPVPLETVAHRVAVEEHPRLIFRFGAPLPRHGRLRLRDTNYSASEGTSRLALRAEGVAVRGYDGPADVEAVPMRSLWQLTDEEERRTKQVEVEFASPDEPATARVDAARAPSRPGPARPRGGLLGLLDRAGRGKTLALGLLALMLGAAHAVQPGHGKTLVAAANLGPDGGAARAALLALVTTGAHMMSVLAIAAALAVTRSVRYAAIDRALLGVSGFLVAAVGLWRLGRHLGRHGEHDGGGEGPAKGRSLIGLGLAGGLVPCWDAILLILLADALGRLALGVALLGMFSLGMGAVLVGVGLAAARLRSALAARSGGGAWERRLGLVSGAALTAIGLWMLYGPGRPG